VARDSIICKKKTGRNSSNILFGAPATARISVDETDFGNEIASLSATYAVVNERLHSAYDEMITAIVEAEEPLH
jgi:hypothetical protein